MQNKTRKQHTKKILSMLLSVIMVFTMIPPVGAFAAGESLSTDKDVYYIGEPIYVNASSDISGAWVGLYNEGGKDGSYWFYYYVSENNGTNRNIYHSTAYSGYVTGTLLPPAKYDVVLYDAGYGELLRKTIEIVAPESSDSTLEVQKNEFETGETIVYKAASYKDGAWVALYSGTKAVNDLFDNSYLTYSYTCGINNAWASLSGQGAGDYTLVLFGDSGYSNPEICLPITVKEPTVELLTTDKTEYTFGEPIMITSQLGEPYWVGLYKQSDANPTSAGPTSLFWLYATPGEPVNILSGEQQRNDEFVAGTYKVLLLGGDYSLVASVENITITAEETGIKETAPTCENDGKIVVSYNDGTTKTITAKEDVSLKATGHAYNEFSYDGDDVKTHTKICTNPEATCEKHSVTEDCTFGEAEITIKAEGTNAGEKTYTCKVCGGTYTEEYYDKVVQGTEIIKAATCQEEGMLRTHYSDGTYSDSVIIKLPCEFGEWKHVKDTKTHERVCMNDGSETGHKETEDCEYSIHDTSNGKFTYTCDTCGGSYSDTILSTDKTEYKFGEPIYVTFNYGTDNSQWIGLYRKGDTPGVPYQEAFYWNYTSDLSSTFNMIDGANRAGNLSDIRWAQFVAGEYTIIIFSNGNYDVATSVDITVTKDIVSQVKTEPTCETDGKIVISYSDGTTETITAAQDATLKATDHAYPDFWTYDKETKTHIKVCANDANHVESETCTFDEGIVTKQPTATEAGEKTFTCSTCQGTYTEVFTDKVLIESKVIKEPTCEEPGVLGSWYEGDIYIETEIPATDHNYGDWTHVEGTKTHAKACSNCAENDNCECKSPVVTENCTHGKPAIAEGKAVYTCNVCNGEYKTNLLTVDKTTFTPDEEIFVTAVYEGEGSWVGLYRENDKYDPNSVGGTVSMYWYSVVEGGINRSGQAINIKNFKNIDRVDSAFTTGNYKLVLFGDGGYTNIIETLPIKIDGSTADSVFSVDVNGQSYSSGSELEFNNDDTIKFKVSAEGTMGNAWVGVYNAKMSEDMDFSSVTSQYWDWIYNIEGKEIDLRSKLDLTYGDYSIVVFGGNGKTDYDDVRCVISFSIVMDASDSMIVKKPTCTNWGTAYVKYDDNTYAYIPVEPLGHTAENWKFNESTHTHSGTCTRENCGKNVTALCTFDEGVVVGTSEDGLTVAKRYTCSVCGGSYIDNENIYVPAEPTVERIYGATRAETSILVADALKAELGVEKFSDVIIADGMNFADALAGSYLAVKKDAPILMYTGTNLTALHQYIKDNLAAGGTVYVLGGINALPESIATGLDGFNVKRLAGATRYETNIEILKESGVTNEEIIISTGNNFADSLSASASGKPILLVNNKTGKLTDAQEAYLKTLSISKFYIIGGENAVPASIEKAVKTFGSVERIGGATRYETSVMVADKFTSNPEAIVLAYGQNFPDGLCGGPLAAKMNAPLILVEDGQEASAAEYAKVYGIESGVVLGGSGLVSDTTVRNVFNMGADEEIIAVTFKTVNGAIAAEFASEQLIGSGNYHEFIADDSEYTVKIAFYTNDVLGNVKFNSLQWNGTSYSVEKELYTLSALSPYKPLVTNVVFYGDTTTYGISFTDKNNNERHFAVYLSGMDGSLIMSEY